MIEGSLRSRLLFACVVIDFDSCIQYNEVTDCGKGEKA